MLILKALCNASVNKKGKKHDNYGIFQFWANRQEINMKMG